MSSRVHKSIVNARVNFIFYLLSLAIAFYSRKVFLDYLGADFMGLTGTIGNLLGILNLANLGIGSTIGFVLYKPIFDKDQEKINEIISVFGYLYRIVGLIILGAGIIMSFFLPLIFPDTPFSHPLIYYSFFAFLASNLFGYFINYRYTLFGADQKGYLVTKYSQSANLVKTLIQMLLLYKTRNLYLWITIELAFGILYCFILNWRIRKEYPWLTTSYALGKAKKGEYGIIMKKAKQMFVHLLASSVRDQVLPFLIYAFTTLKMVAYYGNYMLIVSRLNVLLENFLGSTGAGVGNLIAEGDKEKILKVFWELTAIRYLCAGVITYSIYNLINPFICIWLGEEYILNTDVLVIILLAQFFKIVRGTNEQFIYGYGLYQDTWAPIVTLIITFGVAFIGGNFWGLAGVLSGDVASVLIIIFIWKPIFLFHKGFCVSKRQYWLELYKYFLSLSIVWVINLYIIRLIPIDASSGYINWVFYATIIVPMFSFSYLIIMFILCQGMRDFVYRIIRGIQKK